MDMKEEILKILNGNSYKVDLLGTNEESIQATDGERIIDTEDIEIITDELIKLFSLHNVSNQRGLLRAYNLELKNNYDFCENISDVDIDNFLGGEE